MCTPATQWNWTINSKRTKQFDWKKGESESPLFHLSAVNAQGQPRWLPNAFAHSTEELDFWIPRNHRTRDDQHDDHNHEFHVALTILP